MPDAIGTRIKASDSNMRANQGSITRSYTRDQGMTKLVTDSFSFDPATGRISGSAGDFAAFVVEDPIFVAGTQFNNGYFVVQSVAGDGSYIVVDPPPKTEVVLATIRTN
jgi:hypothetical protein